MRLSHIGNDTAIRLSNMNQRLDFTRMIGSHFNDSYLMFRLQAQQGQGHANMVIEISLCIEHSEFLFQYGCNQFLRSGFPVGTGYSHHASPQLTTMIIGQLLQRLKAIFHQQDTWILR